MLQRRRQRKINAVRKLQESIARRKSLQTSRKVGICREQQQATNDRSTPVSFPPMICARSRGSTTARETNDGTRCVVKMRSKRYMEGFGKGFKSLAMLNYLEVKSNILPLCAIGFQMQSKAENSVCDVVKGKSFNWISSKWRSYARPRHRQVRSCRIMNSFCRKNSSVTPNMNHAPVSPCIPMLLLQRLWHAPHQAVAGFRFQPARLLW